MPEIAPLHGLKVVELAQGISGPYCGWLMANAGAEVVKVEPLPDGDYLRAFQPHGPDGSGAAFAAINCGKQSVALWPEEADSRETIRGLLESADVVILDEDADSDGEWTATWIVEHANAETVICRTSPCGGAGPATELEVQAMSGLTRYLGAIGDPPVRLGADVGSILAGAFLFQGALAALLERNASGKGQIVESSGLGALAAVSSVMIAALDEPDAWEGFHCMAATDPRDDGVATRDGAVSLSAPRRSDEEWIAFCQDLGAEKLSEDPDYAHASGRIPRMKKLNRDLSQYTKAYSRDEVLRIAQRHDALAVPVQDQQEVFQHPQAEAVDAVAATADGPRLAVPWRINGRRPKIEAGVLDLPDSSGQK